MVLQEFEVSLFYIVSSMLARAHSETHLTKFIFCAYVYEVYVCGFCMGVCSVCAGECEEIRRGRGCPDPPLSTEHAHVSRCAGVAGRRLLRGVCWAPSLSPLLTRAVTRQARTSAPRTHPGDNNDIFSIAEEGSCRAAAAPLRQSVPEPHTGFRLFFQQVHNFK